MSDSEDESSSGMEDDSSTTSKDDRENHAKMTVDEQLEAVEPHPNSFVKLTNLGKDFGATPEKQHEPLVELTRPHRDSFDWLINEGLFHIARDLPPMEFQLKNGCRISINFEEIEVNKPTVSADDKVWFFETPLQGCRSFLLFTSYLTFQSFSFLTSFMLILLFPFQIFHMGSHSRSFSFSFSFSSSIIELFT